MKTISARSLKKVFRLARDSGAVYLGAAVWSGGMWRVKVGYLEVRRGKVGV